MKMEFEIEGMSCENCRKHIENALNNMEGVLAVVTLEPPAAVLEFSGQEKTIEDLQKLLSEAGDYRVMDKRKL